ncbi:hypothetical protein ACSBR1_023541 [Camellia fascicularis]
MENEVVMAPAPRDDESNPQILSSMGSLPTKSFKEALTTTRISAYLFDDRMQILSSDEENDDQEGHQDTEQLLSEPMNMPTISLSKKLRQKIGKPWESALIIRLLGKSIGYNMLCTRVKNIWGLQDEFFAIDLGCN